MCSEQFLHHELGSIGTKFHINLRKAGTWDPPLQYCSVPKQMHPEHRIQKKKKKERTKNNCIHAQLGQIMNSKIPPTLPPHPDPRPKKRDK